jgi:heme/copper-type cytochrome/quinol oxidase subunit 2
MQEFALLENYAATSFFPGTLVVLQNMPVRIYFSRLHREHVNRFSIQPFLESTDVILPGEVAVFEFVADRVGVFPIRNEGHGFEATLIVVTDEEAAVAAWSELGAQQLALIFRLEDERVFPPEVQLFEGIPARVFNLALGAEHRVSVPPFYVAQQPNVGPGEISTFDFTPDREGSFVIEDELHGLAATLTVR